RSAAGGTAASGYDLLTVVMHEMAHTFGLDDVDTKAAPHDLLARDLATGVRRMPAADAWATVVTPTHDDASQAPVAVTLTSAALALADGRDAKSPSLGD